MGMNPRPPHRDRTPPVTGRTPPRTGSVYFSYWPATGRQNKQPRKPFQINSVSITGTFMKINYLGDVYRREPFGADGRSEGKSAGLRSCHSRACGTSPAFRCASLPLSGRRFQPVTCSVRISFVQRSQPHSWQMWAREESVCLNPLLWFLEMTWGCFPSTTAHLKEERTKCALELGRRANFHSFIHPFIHTSCSLVHWFIK